jgi:xylulokinase
VFAFMENPARDQKGRVHTFCHAVPQKWHVMGVTQVPVCRFAGFVITLAGRK